MRVAVLGAGAVGSWVGGVLAHAGHEVWLIGRRDHMAVVAERGLRISGETTLEVRPHAAVERAADVAVPDLLLVTVKAYDTAAAIESAAPILGERTRVLSLQNGLGNVETIAEAIDDRRVFAGVTTHGLTFVEPGHVRHAGRGDCRVGSPFNEHAAAAEMARSLTEAGVPTEATTSALGEVWAKVIVNVAINPLTAVSGLSNGALIELPYLREVMERAAEEAIDVARAEGVPLPEDDLVARARHVAERTAKNRSSMLQDITRGKPTEIDAICGEIVQRGRTLGIDTPVNLALRAMVKGIEASLVR